MDELQNEAKEVISNDVLPAFKNMEIYILDEYINHLRSSPGISSLPNGLEMYQGYLEYHTTISDISPGFKDFIGFKNLNDFWFLLIFLESYRQ